MAGRKSSNRKKCKPKMNRYDPARPDYNLVHRRLWRLSLPGPTPVGEVPPQPAVRVS